MKLATWIGKSNKRHIFQKKIEKEDEEFHSSQPLTYVFLALSLLGLNTIRNPQR